MMGAVQLSIADTVYAAHLRDALSRSGPWNVECVDRPHLDGRNVLVLDEVALAQLPHPFKNPERVVLISRQEPELLAQAWEAGIVSVVSSDDSLTTVLLAIMAASLRIAKPQTAPVARVISPNLAVAPAQLSPDNQTSRSKRCKTR
jgi:DNA-binding NarL/FixJ family response regulator